jgi:hypothetical protein
MKSKIQDIIEHFTLAHLFCTDSEQISVVCGSAQLGSGSELIPELVNQLQLRAGAAIYGSRAALSWL